MSACTAFNLYGNAARRHAIVTYFTSKQWKKPEDESQRDERLPSGVCSSTSFHVACTPQQALETHFGLTAFRPPQEAVVASILSGRDTLVIMPTGGGKSLCYQLPAMLLDGVTVVVSPLIALMKDQVDALVAKGLPAAMVNSSQSWEEQRGHLDALRQGELKLVYVAPERFRAQSFVNALAQAQIGLLAIDEAHCISQWGHDFRPDYMRLGEARQRLGAPLTAAFTATATPEVRADIAEQLSLREPATFVRGFARDNLTFRVTELSKKKEKFDALHRLVTRHGTGIVYCATRKSVEKVAASLGEARLPHIYYHAGMTEAERERAQNCFMDGEVPVAVATNAFGMGIDRADLRFVVHFEIPGSVEAFYQEAGRAGRDGLPAHCELLFHPGDRGVQEFFLEGSNPEPATIRALYQLLLEEQEENHEVHRSLDDLVEAMPPKTNPMAVGTALGILRRAGAVERFVVAGERIRGTRLLRPDLPPEGLELPVAQLAEKRRRDFNKLEDMLRLAQSNRCRQQWFLDYFGERDHAPCGRCDVCQSGQRAGGNPIRALTPDELLLVRKALSGVARASWRRGPTDYEARYGRSTIIQMLRGSGAKKLAEQGLSALSTYGLLKAEPERFVAALFDALEGAGCLERVRRDEFNLLGITTKGVEVMTGREPGLTLAWPEDVTAEAHAPGPADEALLAKLIAKRNDLRRARGNVPAYVIFPNPVLRHLAARRPLDAATAQEIPGIGPAKAATILPAFLEIIATHETR